MAEKFENKQEIVLYAILRNRKKVNVDELKILIPEMNEKQIRNSLASLIRRKLILKVLADKVSFAINKSTIERTKKIIGEHFESQWEGDWR